MMMIRWMVRSHTGGFWINCWFLGGSTETLLCWPTCWQLYSVEEKFKYTVVGCFVFEGNSRKFQFRALHYPGHYVLCNCDTLPATDAIWLSGRWRLRKRDSQHISQRENKLLLLLPSLLELFSTIITAPPLRLLQCTTFVDRLLTIRQSTTAKDVKTTKLRKFANSELEKQPDTEMARRMIRQGWTDLTGIG